MELNKVFEKYFIPCIETPKENCSICKECGGKCCNCMGCHISPFDLKEINKESIIALIDESQCISIDWWEGNPATGESNGSKSFYLRIRNKDATVIDPAFGGHPCILLTDTGCPLCYKYRPKGARDLIPNATDECDALYEKQQCAIDWMPYSDIMREVYNYYVEKGEVTPNIMEFMKWLLGVDDE
jgi:hypothetical protein